MYNVIDIESSTPILDDNGNVRVFDTAQDAMIVVRGLFAITGKKYKPKQVIDSSWHEREKDKYYNGEYVIPFWTNYYFHQTEIADSYTGNKKLVWKHTWYTLDEMKDNADIKWENITLQVLASHYLHVSKLNPEKIAFTENEEKGTNNIQTQMNVSRYLINVLNIDSELAKYVSSLHAGQYSGKTVLFADDSVEIAKIYKSCNDTGTRSCMTKDDDYYDSFCHPTLVYGNGDISLAYIKDSNDSVVARALVWQDKKAHGRLYGDYELLRSQLKALGYDSDNSFQGAKIKRIYDEDKGRLVLPYLDGIQTVSIIDDKWLMIDDNGDIQASTTDGLAREEVYGTCDRCEEDIYGEDDAMLVRAGRRSIQTWCGCCANNNAFTCNSTHDLIDNDEERVVDGQSYASWIVEEECNYCDYSEEYTFNDVSEVYMNETCTEQWNVDHLDDNSFICRIDGKRYRNELIANDSWNDNPRAIFNIPDDIPENCNDNIAYRCHSFRQERFAF